MGAPLKWIRIDRPFPLPKYVKEALQKLDQAGHVAYVVGGSVRDFLLGRQSKDHDIATGAGPDELCALFPDAVTVGKAFGVLKIPIAEGGAEFLEIATFREDLSYQDHRHPVAVRFAGPVEDAERRDFSINALYFDVKTSRILDSVQGMEDLQAKVIRAIGEPKDRFQEDALRLLRAVRFAASLGFTIESKTEEAIRAKAKLIQHVSGERIHDEMTRMLTGPRSAQAIAQLSEMGILKHIIPEVEALKGVVQASGYAPLSGADAWQHTLRALRFLEQEYPNRSAALAWATLLHDIGKPVLARSGAKNFNGHELEGIRLVALIAARLKMSRADSDRIAALVQDHLKFKDVFGMREATLLRLLRQPYFEELLALHKANALAFDGNLAAYEFCASRHEALKKLPSQELPRLIDGSDLIQLGLRPGPEFSEILRTIEDLALERKLQTKEQALEYVIQHFVK